MRKGVVFLIILSLATLKIEAAEVSQFSQAILKGYIEDPVVKSINLLIEEIEVTFDKERMKEAENRLKGYVNQEPKNFLSYYFLARYYNLLGNFYGEYKGDKRRGKECFELALVAV